MKKIIEYEVFKSNKEFIKFQNKNNIGVVSVSPFVSKMKMDHDNNNADAKNEISVFVVFIRVLENDE